MDDSTSTTLTSASCSMNEKAAHEAEQQSTREVTRSPTPTHATNENGEVPQLHRTTSIVEKAATAELTKIMTSEEGREYPTGVKLGKVFG
jgi:hypothetical protein